MMTALGMLDKLIIPAILIGAVYHEVRQGRNRWWMFVLAGVLFVGEIVRWVWGV